MISHWEEFEFGPTKPRNRRKHVTISEKNVIYMNGNVYEALGSPKAVTLLFDKLNSVIGVRSAEPERPNAFEVEDKLGTRARFVRATPFCRHYGISIDGTRSFQNPDIDPEGVLRLDLKRTAVSTRRMTPASISEQNGTRSEAVSTRQA